MHAQEACDAPLHKLVQLGELMPSPCLIIWVVAITILAQPATTSCN
jgi:hypothetical protein